MKKLLVFGLDDLAEIAKFYFENDSDYEVVAFTVDKAYRDKEMFCGLLTYDFEDIEKHFPPEEYEMFIAVAYSHVNTVREDKYHIAKEKGYNLASYISSHITCWIPREQIGDNCFILEDNTIQPFVTIGNNVVLWSGNHIGHHGRIDDNVFITSHVVVSGRCHIGKNSFLGVNATINDHINIAPRTVIGSGALITRDTEPGSVYKEQYTPKHTKTSDKIGYFKGNSYEEN